MLTEYLLLLWVDEGKARSARGGYKNAAPDVPVSVRISVRGGIIPVSLSVLLVAEVVVIHIERQEWWPYPVLP